MGFELAEQLGWELPDAIFYPTGGGTGLIGMWKAFDELEAVGLIGPKRPRMYAVQAEGCAPIVRAFERGDEFAERWENAATVATGIRVPKAVGDFLILRAVRESGGARHCCGRGSDLESRRRCRARRWLPVLSGGRCSSCGVAAGSRARPGRQRRACPAFQLRQREQISAEGSVAEAEAGRGEAGSSLAHIRVAPAGLTLPGHHASFVFRLRKHKDNLADCGRECESKNVDIATKWWMKSVDKPVDSAPTWERKEPRRALA